MSLDDDFLGEETRGTQVEDPALLRRDARIQASGKQIISTLYMLVRNVKIHSPDNQIFLKPIDTLKEIINTLIASEKQVNLQASKTNVVLNGSILKFDFTALENVAYLTKEFQTRDVGGFSTKRPVTSHEIRDFLYLFTGEFKGPAPEEGARGKELPSLRLARYGVVKELIDKMQDEIDLNQQIDRKKYLMTVYSRAVFFMRKYFEYLEQGKLLPFAKAARLVQDLIDLCKDQRTHFLGLTTSQSTTDYLPFHSVNTALLSIVFGSELGLDRKQLHELGMAALFSQLGLVGMPAEILNRKGGLSVEERALIDLHPVRCAKRILSGRGLDKSTISKIVATFESKIDFAIPKTTDSGEVELIMPKINLGAFGKIIAIAECYDALTSRRPFREAYGPEIALALMVGELKYKFDPLLLRIFMRVMAIQPVKILEKNQSSIRIG